MVNWFLIVTIVIVAFVILAASCYFMIYFQHTEERYAAWIPKFVVLISLWVACSAVFLVPLDVQNQSTSGGLNFAVFWQILFMIIWFLAMFCIPWSIMYYENDDVHKIKQIIYATLFTIINFVIFLVVFAIFYSWLGYLDMDVINIYTTFTDYGPADSYSSQEYKAQFTMRLNPAVYILAMMVMAGWILLVVFGGIGLTALPMDLFNEWRTRPKSIEVAEYVRKRNGLKERADHLLEVGKQMELDRMGIRTKHSSKRKQKKGRRFFRKYQAAVYFLEEDNEKLKTEWKLRGGNPLKHWMKLPCACCFGILSFVWFLHILLYLVIPGPPTPFLNSVLIFFDDIFTVLALLVFGLFAFYILVIVIKGATKFGLRFMIVHIHPMRVHGTLMNAFLFNTMMFLLASVAVVQFTTMAFSQYARLTAISLIVNSVLLNLRFLKYFFKYYYYVIFFFGIVALIYLCIRPKDKKRSKKYADAL